MKGTDMLDQIKTEMAKPTPDKAALTALIKDYEANPKRLSLADAKVLYAARVYVLTH